MIYVLLLEHEKLYVGYTNRENGERFLEHFNGEGAEWTKKYKPIQVLKWLQGSTDDEDRVTLNLMREVGWVNVRGGKWCKVNMTEPPEELVSDVPANIKNAVKNAVKNKHVISCHRCGRSGHTLSNCYAKTTINGKVLDQSDNEEEDNEEEDNESESNTCYTCGKFGHWAIDCYANSSFDDEY